MKDNHLKLLLCTDGSEQANRAVRLGSLLAVGCQAEVTLLGIAETPGHSAALLDSLKRGQNWLEEKKIAAELIVKSGKPVQEIIKRTEETPYDLVVIGAVRKGTRGAFWMSSKSYKIIKTIKPPVLSVAGDRTAIQRILICSGGKQYIDPAVRLTGQIARGLGASVAILHVMAELPAIYAPLRRMSETVDGLLRSNSELGTNLRRGKETLEEMGVPVGVRLRHGSVLEEIFREMHQGQYDLIVTGSGLTRSLRTYVLGDISREIVNRMNGPVLIVPSQHKPLDARFDLKHWLSWSNR